MRKKINILTITILITCLITHYSLGQVAFQKTFGGADADNGRSVQQTADGGYVITGYTESFGAGLADVYLIRMDANGNALWTKTYGGTDNDRAYSLRQTADGGYIITGRTNSFGSGNEDVYLIRTDANGDTLWTRAFGGTGIERGNSVQQTADGGYIIAGRTSSFGAGGYDVYLIRTDANGDTLWTKTYGGTGDDRGYSVQQTADAGYIITGRTSSFGAGGRDVYLIKTDSFGDTLWTKTFGETGTDVGRSVKQTADSGYIIVGYTSNFGAGGSCTPSCSDVYLIKTDVNGDTLWTKIFGGTSYDYAYSVQQTADGGYIITGETSSFGAGAIDVYLIKTNSIGDTLWTRTFGGANLDIGYSVKQTANGGYIIAGISSSFGAGGEDVYLIKTDANGNSGCNQSATATVVNNTSTMVSSGATIGSGTVVNSTATIVSNAATIDSVLCINCNILLSVTINNVSCNGICNGMATVTPSGGIPNYIYVWEDSLGVPITGETDSIIVGLCAGDYAAVITDTNGCIATAPVTITEPAVFASSITATTDVSCNGLCDGMATVTPSGGTLPYTYQWLDSTFTPLVPTQTDSTATGLCAGLYIIQVNDSNNCFVIVNTTINQPPGLTSSITDTTQASCSGTCIGSVTVTPAGGASPYTYLWDDPAGQTDSTATGLCAGTYTVTITDTNGCMVVESINITQPPLLTIALVSTIPASCNGCDGEAVVTGIAGTPPYTYLWDDSLAQTTPTADSLCASTYNATVTDAKGCSATLTVVVSSASGLSSSITNITNTSCFAVCNGEATVSVSGGSLPYTYSWDSLGVPMPAETDSTITGLCAGNYTAVITDNSGCITTAPVIITQPAVFTSSITSFTDIACNGLCDGMATVTAVGGTLPYTYNWLDNLLNPIGQITSTADILCAGAYNVTIDDANGCFSLSTITITEPPPLTSAITDSSTLVCVCDGFATVTPSGGIAPYAYLWDASAGGQADSTATGLCAGVYNVTVTDANGCVITLSVVITSPNGLVSTINTTINASCNGVCDGEAVVMASGGIPPFTYAWVDLSADTIPGQTNSIITGLCSGNYLAMVSDSDGCLTSTTVTITEPSILTSNVTNIVLVSCFDSCDGSAVVTPSGGTAPYTYLWDPQTGGQTDSTAVDLCIGTYNAVITDDNNCTDTSSVIITGPTILFLLTDATCFGICDGTATAQPAGGLAPYIYLWDDPLSQTDSIATGLCEGAYTVIVTDANGCVILDSTTIVTPSTQVSQTNASCSNICDGTVRAQPVSGLAPYTYLWDDALSQTDSIATGLCEGTYTVIVTDANGCATANSALIAVDNASPISSAGDNITICEGESAFLMASGGTSYAWSPPSGLSCTNCQSPVANPALTTTYTVTVTNLACSDTDAVIVTVGLCLENIPQVITPIPQVITPNGDGANDIFEITGIESYPENKIMIFNRWGNIIFSADGYHNVNNYWDGTSNSGGRLPDGIYFYVLNLGDGNEPYTGFVMIHR